MQFWNWGKSGFDFNPHFFIYPGFTFYVNFLTEGIQYIVGYMTGVYTSLEAFHKAYLIDPSSLVVISRVLMILFDLGSLIITYRLGCLVSNQMVGLIAAFLLAINPLHIQRSHLINVDTPLTFFCILSVYFIYKLNSEPRMRWYIWAGISIGLAAATKYNGSILVIVLIIAHLLRRTSIRQAIIFLKDGWFLASLVISGCIFALFNPYIMLRFDSFLKDLFEVELHMVSGHLGLDPHETTIGFYFLGSMPQNLGWPLLIITILSSIYLISRKNATYLVLLAFPFLYLALINSLAMRDDRYIFPIFPALFLIAAIGIGKTLDWMTRYFKEHESKIIPQTFKTAITFCCGLVIILPPLFHTWEYQKTIGLQNTRDLVRTWIIKNSERGAAIASGPFAITLPENRFMILPIPFNAGNTEKTIPFYDPAWYENIDLVITSDYDYGRYTQDPARFRSILNFYDTLRTRWTLAYEVAPSDTTSGPTFWLYKPPLTTNELFNTEKIHNLEASGDSIEVINFLGKLALILEVKGKFAKSEQLLREVLLINPNNLIASKHLITILGKLEKYPDLLAETRKYLQIRPSDPEIMAMEGNALLRLGQLDAAENALNNALSIDNHIESAYLDLTILYSAENDRQKVIDILSRYLAILPPQSQKARIVEQQLNAIKNGL